MFADNAHEPSHPQITFAQFCYEMAYFMMPQFADRGADALREIINSTVPQKGPYFYELACKFRGVAPHAELAQRFLWEGDTIKDDAYCYSLKYPPTPVVDLKQKSVEENLDGNSQLVLAPYFSAFVHECGDDSKFEYYVLGQAPAGGATLRCITPDGRNLRAGDAESPSLRSLYIALGIARTRMKTSES